MFRKISLLSSALVLLSGCLEPDIGASSTSEVVQEKVPELSNLGQMTWDSCMDITTSVEDPELRLDGGTPDGWRYDTFATPRTQIDLYVCNRIAVNSFERSDVAILLETSNGPEGPPACLEATSGTETVKLVRNAWISDSDIATSLEETSAVQFSVFEAPQVWEANQPEPWEIKWSSGDTLQHLTLHTTADAVQSSAIPISFYYWVFEDRLTIWEAQLSEIDQSGGVIAATGEVRQPHRNPNPTGAWVGGADFRVSNAKIQALNFEDTLCEEPF